MPGPAPPRELIERTLREQGVTYEQLVAFMLMDHEEYEEQSAELERFAGDLRGRMRIMISNYTPEAPQEAQPAIEEIALSPIHTAEEYDIEFSAEEYDLEFAAEENNSFINFRRNLAFEDLRELEMDMAEFMVDYAAQPKTPICVK